MIIKLDFDSNIPIYLQLRNEIVKGIGEGVLEIGEKLPTVREMAEDLGINPMTVSKAYGVLKNEGFISIDRRHGAKVKPVYDGSLEFKEKLESDLTQVISEAGAKGLNKDDFMNICEKIFKKISDRKCT